MEDITPQDPYDETATITETTPKPNDMQPKAREITPPQTDIKPDKAFERMVEASKRDGEKNLLSEHAPQE